MNGDLKICPDAGYVIAVLSNLDPMAASRISEFIANRLPLAAPNQGRDLARSLCDLLRREMIGYSSKSIGIIPVTHLDGFGDLHA